MKDLSALHAPLHSNSADDDASVTFWVGEGETLREMLPEALLHAFEEGEVAGDVPVRIQREAPPRPLARYISELVWMTHRRRSKLRTRDRVDSLFETAFERAPIGMVLSDLVGRIRHANAAFCAMVGYSHDELCEMRVGQLSDARDRELEISLGNQLLAGHRDSFQIEKRFRARSGEQLDALTSIALVRLDDGAPGWVIAHVLDLTPRRSLESNVEVGAMRLRESEARFAQLFRLAPQATLIVDGQGRVAQSNLKAQALFGYEEHEFTGVPLAALVRGLTGDAHDAPAAAVRSDDDGPQGQHARRGQRRDGTPFDVEVYRVELAAAGDTQVLIGLVDVTERLAAQRAMARSIDEKALLLKEIHHRVKNNLQIISSLIALQSEQIDSAFARSQLQATVHRVRTMALIHEQFYGDDSLARIELKQYVTMLGRYLCAALAQSLRLHVIGPAIDVEVDQAVPLGLILNELLTNAIKYGQSGSRGRTGTDCDVLVELASEGGNLRIAVTDCGDGPPPNYQSGRPTTLGYQLIRSLSRQLRAKITVDGGAGRGGTRVELVCPFQAAQATR